MTIFRNRRAEALEERLIDERHDHNVQMQLVLKLQAERIADMQSLHTTMEYEAMRERTELKSAHAAELNRVIEENQRLKDDLDRFRLLLTPALQTVELPKEREAREAAAPEPASEVFQGTPFQRLAKQVIAEQEKAAKTGSRKYVKPADAPLPQGESHGVSSEGRIDASLGGASKPA